MAGILYFPLNRRSGHIRLISLHPGTFDDDIECDLLQAPLQHFKRYEALSYAWGDYESISSIMLKSQQFPDSALRYLRYEPVPGRVKILAYSESTQFISTKMTLRNAISKFVVCQIFTKRPGGRQHALPVTSIPLHGNFKVRRSTTPDFVRPTWKGKVSCE